MAGHPTVLHVAQPTDGGVARFVIDIAAAQARAGWTVAVASPDDEHFTAQIIAAGATHHPWSATRNPGPRTLREIRSLRTITSSVQPDLVHLHSSKAGFAGRIGKRNTAPVIFQPHAWSFEAVNGMQHRLSLGWERRGAHARRRVVVCERGRTCARCRDADRRTVPRGDERHPSRSLPGRRRGHARRSQAQARRRRRARRGMCRSLVPPEGPRRIARRVEHGDALRARRATRPRR